MPVKGFAPADFCSIGMFSEVRVLKTFQPPNELLSGFLRCALFPRSSSGDFIFGNIRPRRSLTNWATRNYRFVVFASPSLQCFG
jgi:hypothetical protein